MKRNLIEVHYLDGRIEPYPDENLFYVIEECFNNERDPEKLVIDNEITLSWNPFLFNRFITDGGITEQELINATKI